MKKGWWVLLFVTVYAAFLLITAPASWVAYGLKRASRGALLAESPQGSVWDGRGSLYWQGGPTPVLLGQVHWRVQGLALLGASLRVRIVSSGPIAGEVTLTRSWSHVVLTRLQVSAEGQVLRALSPQTQLLAPSGRMHLVAGRLGLRPGAVSGGGAFSWRDAGLAVSTIQPLGSYRATFDGRGSALYLAVHTLSGPLVVAGRGSWSATGVFQFAGQLSAPPDEPRLIQLIQLVGTPQGADTQVFRVQLQTPAWGTAF